MISKEPGEDTVRRREFKTKQNTARQIYESAGPGVTTGTRKQKPRALASPGGGFRMKPDSETAGLLHTESNVAQAAAWGSGQSGDDGWF